jgi:hypothetical protein
LTLAESAAWRDHQDELRGAAVSRCLVKECDDGYQSEQQQIEQDGVLVHSTVTHQHYS